MTAQTSPIFTLPPEIRFRILDPLIPTDRSLKILVDATRKSKADLQPIGHNIPYYAAVCRQFREDALSLFYSKNHLLIYESNKTSFSTISIPKDNALWRRVSSYAKHVTIIFAASPKERLYGSFVIDPLGTEQIQVRVEAGSKNKEQARSCWCDVHKKAKEINEQRREERTKTAAAAMAEWIINDFFFEGWDRVVLVECGDCRTR